MTVYSRRWVSHFRTRGPEVLQEEDAERPPRSTTRPSSLCNVPFSFGSSSSSSSSYMELALPAVLFFCASSCPFAFGEVEEERCGGIQTISFGQSGPFSRVGEEDIHGADRRPVGGSTENNCTAFVTPEEMCSDGGEDEEGWEGFGSRSRHDPAVLSRIHTSSGHGRMVKRRRWTRGRVGGEEEGEGWWGWWWEALVAAIVVWPMWCLVQGDGKEG